MLKYDNLGVLWNINIKLGENPVHHIQVQVVSRPICFSSVFKVSKHLLDSPFTPFGCDISATNRFIPVTVHGLLITSSEILVIWSEYIIAGNQYCTTERPLLLSLRQCYLIPYWYCSDIADKMISNHCWQCHLLMVILSSGNPFRLALMDIVWLYDKLDFYIGSRRHAFQTSTAAVHPRTNSHTESGSELGLSFSV